MTTPTQPTREERCCDRCWKPTDWQEEDYACHNRNCPCHSPADTKVEDWEKEAREIVSQVCCDGQYVNQSISFIRNLLAAHRSQLLSSIRGEIEGMKKQEFWVKGIAEGYKQALDDILSLPDLSPDL